MKQIECRDLYMDIKERKFMHATIVIKVRVAPIQSMLVTSIYQLKVPYFITT